MNKTNKFQKLFKEYYTPLCNYALKITRNNDEAEDIVQNLFLHFWESNSLDGIDNIERYLLRSVKFKCIDYLRNKNKSKQVQIFDIKDISADSNTDLLEEEIEPLLAYFSAKLPPKTREVFLLSRNSSKTYKQISEELEISIKTVESQMSRALKQMRKMLNEQGFFSLFLHI